MMSDNKFHWTDMLWANKNQGGYQIDEYALKLMIEYFSK